MKNSPELYSLDVSIGADFWAQAGNAARRTFLMPLSSPFDFIAFGVLAPSHELHFVDRGQVLDHLGEFIRRMTQAGASVELYARAPLPDSVLAPYIDDGPYPQKEVDQPPAAPNSIGRATLSTGQEPVSLSSGSNLWSMTGSARRVLVTAVPNVSSESLVIGMVMVDQPDYLWRVNFVARMAGSDIGSFLSRMPTGTTAEYNPPTPLPAGWEQSLFPSGANLSASVAQLGPAASGGTRVSLG